MGEVTKIGWTGRMVFDPVTGMVIFRNGASWNPWIGCAHASEGCKFCYAEDQMDTRWGKVVWGNTANSTRVRTSPENWGKLIQWNRKAEKEGIATRVFIASLADVFEPRAELTPWRRDMFALLERVRSLNLLVLTKRAGLMPEMIEEATGVEANEWLRLNPHVWLGTSVENQRWADERVPQLGKLKPTVRFLSVEPMLGPVDLRDYRGLFEWVIVGGESGRHARPMSLEAAERVIQDSQEMGVPVYMKQTGAVLARELGLKHTKGEDADEWPESLRVQEWPD